MTEAIAEDGPPPKTILPPYRLTGPDGHLEYADGRSTACAFEVSQDVDGDVSLVCEHDRGDWVFAEGFGQPSPCRFWATTSDDTTLFAEGKFIQLPDHPDDPSPERAVRVR